MKQGLITKKIHIFVFFFACLIVFSAKYGAEAIEIKYESNVSCVNNAIAPLDSLSDIQTFLSCNGFNPGPIDGLSGSRTNNAIITFKNL